MSLAWHGNETLIETIRKQARLCVFERAVNGSDSFRQWLYPLLPAQYIVTSALDGEIERLMLRGKSAEQIAEELYRIHG